MHIHAYQPSDEFEVISLWERCRLLHPLNDPRRDIRRKLQVAPELFLVGIEDGVLIGTVMAGYEGHRGWINYLAVTPELRGRGYGRQMMEAAESLLRERGCPKINLQVRASNEAVIAFYRALGFQRDEVISLGKQLE